MVVRTLAPYEFTQRTEYSKIVIVNAETGENITETDKEFANNLLKKYKDQMDNTKIYCFIENNTLNGFKSIVVDDGFKFIFVPDGITKINKDAFEDTVAISISLPNSLEVICESAFYGSLNLEKIYIPDSVKTIENFAFGICSSLSSVRLPIELKRLPKKIFYMCESLKEIDLPDSLQVIESEAFLGCTSLTKIIIPDKIEEIKFATYKNCTMLESAKLPAKLKIIGEYAFADCENLSNIVFPDALEKIDGLAFAGCKNFEEINIPDSVKEIGYGAFSCCENLKKISLPRNLKELATEAFANCPSIEDVMLPDCLKVLKGYLFRNTKRLTKINVPKNLTAITTCPFVGSSIESLIFNYDLKELELSNEHVDKCDLTSYSKINKLVIDGNVTKITREAFKYSGGQITQIDYNGTKEQFEIFKKNNKKLFDVLPNIEKINFIEKETYKDPEMVEER